MTIFGKHTLDETRDLLAVADYRFKETGKAYDALAVKPDDITADWTALSAKWAKDRKLIAELLIVDAVKGFPLPSSAVATEDEWKKTLDYIQYQELVKGSLQDITKRIETASGAKILYPNQPAPNSTQDVDIDLFKDLDKKTRDLDAAANAAKEGAKDAAFSNWGLMIGGTILVTLVGTQLIKRYV